MASSKDAVIWVRISAATAKELDEYVNRQTKNRARIDLDRRTYNRSAAIREAIVSFLLSDRQARAAQKAPALDPRQAPIPGVEP